MCILLCGKHFTELLPKREMNLLIRQMIRANPAERPTMEQVKIRLDEIAAMPNTDIA